jgi:ferredoxin
VSITARVDPDLCLGSGACVSDAPGAFTWDDDEGVATILPGVAELPDDRLIRLARNCPGSAILLVDDEGNEVDPFG